MGGSSKDLSVTEGPAWGYETGMWGLLGGDISDKIIVRDNESRNMRSSWNDVVRGQTSPYQGREEIGSGRQRYRSHMFSQTGKRIGFGVRGPLNNATLRTGKTQLTKTSNTNKSYDAVLKSQLMKERHDQ